MIKVMINGGHDTEIDSGAVGFGLRECDIVKEIGEGVVKYLREAGGYEVTYMQSDNLVGEGRRFGDCYDNSVIGIANNNDFDVFVSIHANACESHRGRGVECLVYDYYCAGFDLAECIQSQILSRLDLFDRGITERPDLIVLKHTKMRSCLVECAFIDNEYDNNILKNHTDDFSRAIACGISDYFLQIEQ